MGRVAAASEVVIGGPNTLSIVVGAALVAVVDYRLLFFAMAVVTGLAGVYLFHARSLSPRPATPTPPPVPVSSGLTAGPPGEMVPDLDDGRLDQH
jgi:hypothetical protein